MAKVHDVDADVFFTGSEINWRNEESEEDPDDEETQTPPDVIAVLGFDPAKESVPDKESTDNPNMPAEPSRANNPDMPI